jgi:Protein of unknown function (DUF1302)
MISSLNASSRAAVSGMSPSRWLGVIVLVAVSSLGSAVEAQDARFSGLLQLDRRLAIADSVRLIDSYNLFRPGLSATVGGRVDIQVSLDMRFHDFAAVKRANDMTDTEQHFPTMLSMWEAFVRLPGVLADPLDLTVGKQRIQWGTADGLNPTDRFNGYDLSDFTDFTARIPTWAILAEYYVAEDWRIDAVWTPTAHGPLLPAGFDGLIGNGNLPSAPGPVASWVQHFEPLSPRLGNSQFGLRLAAGTAGLDVSISYYDGSMAFRPSMKSCSRSWIRPPRQEPSTPTSVALCRACEHWARTWPASGVASASGERGPSYSPQAWRSFPSSCRVAPPPVIHGGSSTVVPTLPGPSAVTTRFGADSMSMFSGHTDCSSNGVRMSFTTISWPDSIVASTGTP